MHSTLNKRMHITIKRVTLLVCLPSCTQVRTKYSVSGRVMTGFNISPFTGDDGGVQGLRAGNQRGRGAGGAIALADKLVSVVSPMPIVA